jgi:hypothetical protein
MRIFTKNCQTKFDKNLEDRPLSLKFGGSEIESFLNQIEPTALFGHFQSLHVIVPEPGQMFREEITIGKGQQNQQKPTKRHIKPAGLNTCRSGSAHTFLSSR